MFVAVAPELLAKMFPNATPELNSDRVPVEVLATPSDGVSVQDEADVLVAFGMVPAAALVAFVPPFAMGTDVGQVNAEMLLAVIPRLTIHCAAGAVLVGWMNQDVKEAEFGPMKPKELAGIAGAVVCPSNATSPA